MFSYGVSNVADGTDRNVYGGVDSAVAESALAHDGLCEVVKGSVGDRFANVANVVLHGGGLPRCRVEVEMGLVWGRSGKVGAGDVVKDFRASKGDGGGTRERRDWPRVLSQL